MISNVNLNASAHAQNANRVPDEKLRSNSVPAAESVPVKNEDTETAVVDVFTVSFWDRGLPETPPPPPEAPADAAKSVDITVDDEIYLDTSKN